MKNIKTFAIKSIVKTSIALWIIGIREFFGQKNSVVHLFISSPSSIRNYFWDHFKELLLGTWYSWFSAIIWLTIWTILAFLILLIGLYLPKTLKPLHKTMVIIQTIPFISLAPLLIIVFGIGIGSKIAMATISCFFAMFVAFASGIDSISTEIRNFLDLYRTSLAKKIFKVYIPLSLPQVFAWLKVALTLAIIWAIVAEYNWARYGLGKNLFLSAKRLDSDLMMSSIILIIIMTFLLYWMIIRGEKKLWKRYLLSSSHK